MKNFDSAIWENEIYGQGNHLNKYPFDNVVSFVFRNYPRNKKKEEVKILEIGCGSGNNLWFAAREGFKVTGIDGSASAINFANNRFKSDALNGAFLIGDFTVLPFLDASFDLVIDRAALVCCPLEVAIDAVKEVNRVLIPNGKFFFNAYSQAHTSFASGTLLANGFTTEINGGSLTGVGNICFYSYNSVLRLFETGWEIEKIQHKENREVYNGQGNNHAEWEVVVRKK